MTNDNSSAAAQSAASLYGWWFDAIPGFFAGLSPSPPPQEAPPEIAKSEEPEAVDEESPPPFPVDQMVQALERTQQTLAPLYQAYAQALAANFAPQSILGALPVTGEAQIRQFVDVLARFGQALTAGLTLPGGTGVIWSDLLMKDREALGSLMTGAERTFGAVADALGLAPSRELREAWRIMEAAALTKQQAKAEYVGVIARIWVKGVEGLLARLSEMAERGESVESVSALIRLWAKAADEAAHASMQSDEGLQASAKMIRAATRYRQATHRVVAISSQAMNIPTRAEVDDAYREIQELKRELRRLRKSIAAPTTAKRPASQAKDKRK